MVALLRGLVGILCGHVLGFGAGDDLVDPGLEGEGIVAGFKTGGLGSRGRGGESCEAEESRRELDHLGCF